MLLAHRVCEVHCRDTGVTDRGRTGRAGRGNGLNAENSLVILRQASIGVKALSWRVSITVGPRMRRLNVTVLEQSVPTIEADTTFLRAEDAWESAWVPRISIKEVRASNCRRFQWFLERKNVRRINLRCNVNWLPDRGGGKCARETHAQLLGADGGLARV